MYFHTNDPKVLDQLARMLAHAVETGKSVRLDVDSAGRLKWKCGEGMWTFPHDSTPDQYRDNSRQAGACQSHCDIHYFNDDCVGFRNA